VNYKRKSRRQFFLLVRSRTPPISSKFRGVGGFEHTKPPLGTPLPSSARYRQVGRSVFCHIYEPSYQKLDAVSEKLVIEFLCFIKLQITKHLMKYRS